MTGITSFLPAIPDEIRKARLGQGFDSLTGKLKDRGEAFRLDRMAKQQLLGRSRGKLVSTYHANLSSSELASNSFSSVAGQVEGSGWGVTASIGASMATEQSQANSSYSENLVLQSIDSGGSMEFREIGGAMTPEIYSTTNSTFQLLYGRIMKAESGREYTLAYNKFSEKFGDSCVTKVRLVAGSAFQMTLKSENSSVSKQAKYGATASISTPFGGASAASEWGSGMKEKHSKGTMTCTEVHYPDNAPTYKLIHAEFVKRNNKGFDTLKDDGELENSIPDNDAITPVTAPAIIPYQGPDEEVEVPKQELSNDKIKEADDEKDQALAIEDGHEGTLEEYRKDKRKEINDLNDNTTKNGASHVTNEASEALKARENVKSNGRCYYDVLGVTKTATASIIKKAWIEKSKEFHPDKNSSPGAAGKFDEVQTANKTLKDPAKRKKYDGYGSGRFGVSISSAGESSPPSDFPVSSTEQLEITANNNTWSLGGYWVNAYETTKWTELFPELSRNFLEDDSLIYVVRLWLYLLTRLELLEYLRFQIDVVDDLVERDNGNYYGIGEVDLINLKNDANLFSDLCDGLRKAIMTALKKPVFSQMDYLDQILAFDDKLRIDNRFRFSSMTVYDTFFEHYDLFHNNPLGFVRVFNEGTNVTYVTGGFGNKRPIDGLRLPALLTHAGRSYPFIFADGRTRMVHYSSFPHGFDMWADNFFQRYRKEPNGGTLGLEAYSRPSDDSTLTFYGMNYDDLDTNDGKMFGVPFLSKLPFDKIVSSLHSTGA
eukprot:CAMPEP_0171014554 /NCGR_PEP_ID=MMETSP0736-20130129/25221_1 /TAXON_ID=186038 /ORGANISM="Fragilariopsis kerguelensis, Strain L26-C5" /LENGTH=770 /DNA_ID=CAMNT_0011448851 /DNA_START=33 /DNA_END=2345 /DNA_ORIENTATION=-